MRTLFGIAFILGLGAFSGLSANADQASHSASVQLPEVEFELVPLGIPGDRELPGIAARIGDQNVVLLIDSGVEIPVIDRDFARSIALEVVDHPEQATSTSLVDLVRIFSLESETSYADIQMLAGPVFVSELSGITGLGAVALVPPNLLFIRHCRVLDLSAMRLQVYKQDWCRDEFLDHPDAVRLTAFSSAGSGPVSRELMPFHIDGEEFVALIDTGSSSSRFDPRSGFLPTTDRVEQARKADGSLLLAPVIETLCVHIDDHPIYIDIAHSVAVPDAYSADAIVGVDILRRGLLIYIAPGEAYFVLNRDGAGMECE